MKKITFILFCLFHSVFANTNYPSANFSGPRDTMNYFLKTMKGYKLGDQNALALAAKAFNLENVEPTSHNAISQLSSIRLINTLDRMEFIDVQKIPATTKTKWIYKEEVLTLEGQPRHVEISIAPTKDNKWLFTPQTISSLPHFEAQYKNKKLVDGVVELKTLSSTIKSVMPKWTGKKSFVLLNGQWLGLFVLIFLSYVIEKLFRLYLANIILKTLKKRDIKINAKLSSKFTAPAGVVIFSGTWIIGVTWLELDGTLLSWLLRLGYVIFTVGCVVAAHHIVDFLCLFLEKKAIESENKFDDILVPLVRKTAKSFVIAIGIIFIGDSLTLDMKSLLAGMGIGGIAFALAAKDTISNLFGSLTVLLDRPFRIGDSVVVDGNIEGVVEEVGLRSCRIRTHYNSLITMPNGRLTNAHIDNMGARKYRRFKTAIGVQYDTPVEKIESFCEGIRQIIVKHPLTRKDSFHVYLNNMSASSLDILLQVFWETSDYSVELQEKHRLLMDIVRLAQQLEIDFAFPTQTLHMIPTKNREHSSTPTIDKGHQVGIEKANDILGNPMTFKNSRSSAISGNLPSDTIGN